MSQTEKGSNPTQNVRLDDHLGNLAAEVQSDEKSLYAPAVNWENIVRHSPHFVALVDRDLTIIYLNQALPDLNPQDMYGANLLDYILPEFHELVRERNDAVFATGKTTQFEITGMGPDGTTAWYSSRLGPIMVDGLVVSVVHTSRDITKRKLAEEALRESESKIRALLDAIPDAILRFDRDGICLEYKHARDGGHAGLSIDAVGKNLAIILPEEVSSQGSVCFIRAFEEEKPQRFEYQYEYQRTDLLRDYEARVVTSGDNEALLIIHDITQRRKAERAALTTEMRFRQLVERAPVCIFQIVLIESEPLILTANRRAEIVYGMTPQMFRSCRLAKLFAVDAMADLDRLVADADRGQTLTIESRHRSVDGRDFPVRISAAPEAVTSANRMILTVEDITVEKQRRSEIEAIEQERRRIAHEIHDGLAQDLSALRLRSTLWHDLVDADPDKMHAELDELSAILKSCIGEVRHSIFALRPVVLDELGFLPAIRKLLASFANLYSLRPQLEITGPIERLNASYELALFRIVQESLNNVGQHADATSVSVMLEVQATDVVTLTIEDDGVGFRHIPEHRPSMDDHFGLQHMRERMESMGGSFAITSEIGAGTRIQVTLPLVNA